MKTGRRRRWLYGRWERFLRKHDISLRIYLSFVFILIITVVLLGVVFTQMYQKNYTNSYTKLLTKQGKKISKRVSNMYAKGQLDQYIKYSAYVDELEKAENTDVWIMRNEDAVRPLSEDFTNAEMPEDALTKEMYQVQQAAFHGEVSSSSSYDKAYGMAILRVAVPIVEKDTEQVIGCVMMISMIDKQTMGLDAGKRLIIFSALVAILVSFVIALILTQYLSIPINKIKKDINKLAAGEYTEISTFSRSKQLMVLEEQLNYLSSRLAKSEEERENLEQVRRDFFANVSHELRTPITVVRGYAESLRDGVIVDPNGADGLYQRMLLECQGMERLVEDLFILSKMQNPDFEIEVEPVSLRQIFSDVARSGRMMGKDKGISIEVKLPEEDPCMMMGDYGRLRQMFMIIVDNAVKFSKDGGKVHIVLKKEEGKLNISIQDHGVGILAEQLPFIFEKFYKSKMRQNEKGTGLGLMIAKQIALRHGGDIWVESEPGEGSVFYFSFEELTSMEDYE